MGKSLTCPCGQPYYCKGLCKNCYDKHLKQSNPDYRLRQSLNSKAWHKEFPEKVKQLNRAYYGRTDKEHLRMIKFKHRLKKYDLCIEQATKLLEEQDSKCLICGTELNISKTAHLDHDHTNGLVRGFLCQKCNMGLGLFNDKAELFLKAYLYLTDNQVDEYVPASENKIQELYGRDEFPF